MKQKNSCKSNERRREWQAFKKNIKKESEIEKKTKTFDNINMN